MGADRRRTLGPGGPRVLGGPRPRAAAARARHATRGLRPGPPPFHPGREPPARTVRLALNPAVHRIDAVRADTFGRGVVLRPRPVRGRPRGSPRPWQGCSWQGAERAYPAGRPRRPEI